MKAIPNSLAADTKFHHMAIKCTDFDKSFEIYKALGLNPALQWGEGDERGCMMDIGDGSYIELFAGGKGKDEITDNSMIHFCLLVSDCDLFYNKAIEMGCVSKDEPFDLVINAKEKDLPIRISFVIGPDNEVIEFFQYR